MAFSGMKFNADLRIKGNVFSEESAFQQPVLGRQTDATLDPGASPATGARYILTDVGALNANFGTITGVANNDIVEYDGSAFLIACSPAEGAYVYDQGADEPRQFNGTSWGTSAAPDGGDGVTFNTGSNRYDLDLAASSGLELTAGDGSGELQIAADGVTTARILDANVTNAKLASGIDALKISGGSVSNAEFDFLDGVTSGIQGQIDAKQSTSEKDAANGYAGLDANGLLNPAQIPDISVTSVTTVADIAARDALTIGTGQGEIGEGDVVIVTDASGDPAITSGAASYIYNGAAYSLLRDGDDVLSVNGSTGAVTVNAINQLSGDVTTALASGSEGEVATISAGAVDAGKLADDAVETAKILDANVTTAKLAADAVDSTKLADDAVGSEHIQTGAVGSSELAADAVGDAALDYDGLNLRSGALTDAFPSLSRTFTHSWNTLDVLVEAIDSVTGETCYVNVSRSVNAVVVSVNQTPANPLRILLREVKGDQTTIVAS